MTAKTLSESPCFPGSFYHKLNIDLMKKKLPNLRVSYRTILGEIRNEFLSSKFPSTDILHVEANSGGVVFINLNDGRNVIINLTEDALQIKYQDKEGRAIQKRIL